MMGRLARNEVDIGLVDLYVTLVRTGILDYTSSYDSEVRSKVTLGQITLDKVK